MPLIVLATVISAAYAALRANIKHEDLTGPVLETAFLLGLFNLPYFGAPTSVGGPQLFPLNGPQYTLFLELVANVIWSLSRRLNELKVSITIALAYFSVLPFGMGGDTAATFWSGFPRVGGSFFAGVAVFHLDRRLAPRHFGTFVYWGLAAAL